MHERNRGRRLCQMIKIHTVKANLPKFMSIWSFRLLLYAVHRCECCWAKANSFGILYYTAHEKDSARQDKNFVYQHYYFPLQKEKAHVSVALPRVGIVVDTVG